MKLNGAKKRIGKSDTKYVYKMIHKNAIESNDTSENKMKIKEKMLKQHDGSNCIVGIWGGRRLK